jgi:hypothetical protein
MASVSWRGLTSWPSACSWNMRRRHSSHSWLTSAARTAVKGALLCARRVPGFLHERSLLVWDGVAGLTLDGRRSGGYARERAESFAPASILCFQYVYATESLAFIADSPKQRVGRLVLRFQCVDECRHGNALVFATAERTLFIPFMFTLGSKWYLYSYPAGDDVSTFIRCTSSAACLAGPQSIAI